jgi:hypothetical protein
MVEQWLDGSVGGQKDGYRKGISGVTFIERHSWHVQTNPAIPQHKHVVQICIFVTKSGLVTK